VRLRALVDTGASVTCVVTGNLDSLALNPVGVARIHTPTGVSLYGQYDVSITFDHPTSSVTLDPVTVVECLPLASPDIQVLLGRDVLAHCLFVYDGTAGRFSLAF
jgi:hypothetical protein